MDTIEILKNNELFKNLGGDQLKILATLTIKRSDFKNVTVFNEGDHSAAMYIIKHGSVDIFVRNEDGKEMILSTLHAGDHFGELSLFDGKPRSATVKTREKCEFIILNHAAVFQLLKQNPAFAIDVINYLCNKIRFITNIAQDLALLDVYGRLRKLLYHLAAPGENGLLQTNLPLDQTEIALRLGCGREMVNKLLKELETGGYITYTKTNITLNLKLPSAR